MAEGLSELLLILVISSWVNIALFTSELVLCGRYFARPSRPLVHKIGVALLVFADTVCTLAISIDVCLAVLRLPIENPRLLVVPTTVEIMSTYISAVVAQLFLCNLFYVLTGNKIVAGAIFVLIFVHLGFSWASAIISNQTLNYVGIAFTTTTLVRGDGYFYSSSVIMEILDDDGTHSSGKFDQKSGATHLDSDCQLWGHRRE
ncbi:hypothetical protein C8R47DRAFT_1316698 [Mycena vitilis]|nr:hypothetical protein C8R47DRAFT_1316698 [Mycena vitilis]